MIFADERSLCRCTANTDIGPQAVTIFLPDVSAGYRFQQLIDIRGQLVTDLEGIDQRAGASNFARRLPIADDGDLL